MKILNALFFKGEIEMDVNTIYRFHDSMIPFFFKRGDGQKMIVSLNISYIINTSERNL